MDAQGLLSIRRITMIATSFTPIASLLGGALIGLSAVLLMWATGRIAGVSGIAARLFPPYEDRQLPGRLAFVAGLIAAPILVRLATGSLPAQAIAAGTPVLIIAGLLTGFGAVWGNGCTSGHGVCGLSRLSVRSLVATIVFMAAGIATVFVMRHGS
jgi:uncharacterized membrane protein YedE/YeeE